MIIKDWKLVDSQINKQQVKDLVEIYEILKNSNLEDKFIDTKYVLKDKNQIETKIEINDKNNNNKLEQGNLKNEENFLFIME